jgi:hypothetical protein
MTISAEEVTGTFRKRGRALVRRRGILVGGQRALMARCRVVVCSRGAAAGTRGSQSGVFGTVLGMHLIVV